MEKHIEELLNKISLTFVAISTIILLYLYLQTPQTCIPQNKPITQPGLKFPSSTCDPSLNHPHLPLSKKNTKLWSSRSWLSKVSSFTIFFNSLKDSNFINNQSRILCVSAGAGHEVMALTQMGVSDVTGVEIVDSLPLVKRADPNNLPFFDGVFDLAFTAHLEDALFPRRAVAEMERTVRKGGVCVVVVEECGGDEVREFVGMFRHSELVGAENVSLIGSRMTRIIMRVMVVVVHLPEGKDIFSEQFSCQQGCGNSSTYITRFNEAYLCPEIGIACVIWFSHEVSSPN